jgi:hypothetical protein
MAHGNELRGPSFLGIGAPRAGTTWLHANLRSHPQLWLPPLKELHYWDIQRSGALRDYPIRETNVLALRAYWSFINYRMLVVRTLRGQIAASWAMRYAFGLKTDRWYAKLFPNDRMAGEITPGYMLLPPHVIEKIRELNPSLKAILLLRNPVSRAWSNVRHTLGRKVHSASIEQLRARLDSQGSLLRGDYVRTIDNWRGVLGEDKVFIGFYEDLVTNPRGLLREILQFLGVDASDERLPVNIEREVNASPKRDLPKVLVAHSYAHYIDQLRVLEQLLGGPTSKWLAKAEEALAGSEKAC